MIIKAELTSLLREGEGKEVQFRKKHFLVFWCPLESSVNVSFFISGGWSANIEAPSSYIVKVEHSESDLLITVFITQHFSTESMAIVTICFYLPCFLLTTILWGRLAECVWLNFAFTFVIELVIAGTGIIHAEIREGEQNRSRATIAYWRPLELIWGRCFSKYSGGGEPSKQRADAWALRAMSFHSA